MLLRCAFGFVGVVCCCVVAVAAFLAGAICCLLLLLVVVVCYHLLLFVVCRSLIGVAACHFSVVAVVRDCLALFVVVC